MRLFTTLALIACLATTVLAGESERILAGESETMRVETSDGFVIQGEFWAPRKKGRAPAALLLHDNLRDRSDHKSIAESLNKRGFAVLAIDLRGHGKSVSEKIDFAKLNKEERARTWPLAIRDIEASAKWLRERNDIHTSNLSIVAHGGASILAARYAERDKNVRCLGLIAPSTKDLARDLPKTLKKIAGLPCLLVSEKNGRENTVRLAEASFKDGEIEDEIVEINVMRTAGVNLMRDKRLPSAISSFLHKHAISDN